jgi:hypothetical protein
MAIGKEAPVPDICAVALASRHSLETAVAEFIVAVASTPVTTIKRRLRDSEIVLPFQTVSLNGHYPSKPIEPGFASEVQTDGLPISKPIEPDFAPEVKIEGLDQK